MAPIFETSVLAIISLCQLTLSSPIAHRQSLAAGCDSNTLALINGVQNNIAVQYKELALTTRLISTASANNINQDVDINVFNSEKAQLLSTVQDSIAIRQTNQAISINNQDVARGLAFMAITQNDELNAAQQIGNPSNDNPAQIVDSLNSLSQVIQSCINTSSKVLQLATTDCPGNNVYINSNNINNPNNFNPNTNYLSIRSDKNNSNPNDENKDSSSSSNRQKDISSSSSNVGSNNSSASGTITNNAPTSSNDLNNNAPTNGTITNNPPPPPKDMKNNPPPPPKDMKNNPPPPPKDENGNPPPPPPKDGNGNPPPPPPKDENGNPIPPPKDGNGNPPPPPPKDMKDPSSSSNVGSSNSPTNGTITNNAPSSSNDLNNNSP